MTLVINIGTRRGLSRKACHELLSKKSNYVYLPFITHQKPFNWLDFTNKMECFSFFKGGQAVWVVKLIKEDWPK